MKKNNSILLLDLTQGAMIAALYVVLTFIANLAGLASGVIQVRLSEALTILPVFAAAAVPGIGRRLCSGKPFDRLRRLGCCIRLPGDIDRSYRHTPFAQKKSGTGGFAADPLKHHHRTAGAAAGLWSGGRLLVSGDDGRRGRNHLLRNPRAAAL